ncbi:MAG: alpha/beta hydrolase [Oscillospiraceae bacterium]|jgi:pimeloyl-ACP methyl ester carboxylesterase|nr:alpha/beta hydrolase [Oscillospiraceae bacterium]
MLDKIITRKLGGVAHKIHIVSENPQLPVLLELHGGPGVPSRHGIPRDAEIRAHFTRVGYDQRGTGAAWAVKPAAVTLDAMVEDAAELCAYLKQLFHKDRVFVLGGSWGSALGAYLAARHPEHVAAFVGFGQLIDFARNEELSYEFALQAATQAGDTKSLKTLAKIGYPVNAQYKGGLRGMIRQREVMNKYGGFSPGKTGGKKAGGGYVETFAKPIFASGEYTPYDIFGIFWGGFWLPRTLGKEIGTLSLPRDCTEFQVPVFIFDGRQDKNTPAALVEEWFAQIEAPRKQLHWFENSGHGPLRDEPEKFKALLFGKLGEVAADLQSQGITV